MNLIGFYRIANLAAFDDVADFYNNATGLEVTVG